MYQACILRDCVLSSVLCSPGLPSNHTLYVHAVKHLKDQTKYQLVIHKSMGACDAFGFYSHEESKNNFCGSKSVLPRDKTTLMEVKITSVAVSA